eukprot:scaffold22120_cov57-Phaeocystis_antarctica.AAC.2
MLGGCAARPVCVRKCGCAVRWRRPCRDRRCGPLSLSRADQLEHLGSGPGSPRAPHAWPMHLHTSAHLCTRLHAAAPLCTLLHAAARRVALRRLPSAPRCAGLAGGQVERGQGRGARGGGDVGGGGAAEVRRGDRARQEAAHRRLAEGAARPRWACRGRDQRQLPARRRLEGPRRKGAAEEAADLDSPYKHASVVPSQFREVGQPV